VHIEQVYIAPGAEHAIAATLAVACKELSGARPADPSPPLVLSAFTSSPTPTPLYNDLGFAPVGNEVGGPQVVGLSLPPPPVWYMKQGGVHKLLQNVYK
jgi:hypothetical protein